MNSEFTPEDIEKFLNNELDGEKAEKIAAFLEQLPGGELDRHLPDEQFYRTDPVEIPRVIQSVMRKAVRREVTGMSGRWKKPLLIAACVAGFFLAANYLLKLTTQHSGFDLNSYSLNKEIIRNNSGQEKYIHLPDGSGVLLKPNAAITYMDNFKDNRFLYMEGNARFDVKHDRHHPLTVIANGISTLDIGTSFWINSDKSKEEIKVQLLEGSVAVKSLENIHPLKNVYLQPGQQILIRKHKGDYLVSNINGAKHQDANTTLSYSADDKQVVTTWQNAAYSFSKSPLQKVFDQLAVRYQVEIKVDSHIVQDREFTGKIMYTDSLNVLLDAICNLNHLSYIRNGNKIQITEQ